MSGIATVAVANNYKAIAALTVGFGVYGFIRRSVVDDVNVEYRVLSKEWNVSEQKIKASFEQSKHKYGVEPPIIPFLLAKDIQDKSCLHPLKNNESSRFQLLYDQPNNHWKECRRRVDRLVDATGDVTSDNVPSHVQTFEEAMNQMPQWKEEGAYVFHVQRNLPLVQRNQKSGLGYIHAPEVVQHYLVSMQDPKAGMIDMAKMIRTGFDSKSLSKHIFSNRGGDSKRMLSTILQKDSLTEPAKLKSILKKLKLYGPGLISRFAVHEDFKDGKISFDGAPQGELKGYHSMVVIGARTDKSGKNWFLLQNWWEKTQFCEVSETYLQKCNPDVTFTTTPQYKIPDVFPTQKHMYAENENLDKPEELLSEDPPCPVPSTRFL